MILVTGANGLIGSFVCKELIARAIPFKPMKRAGSDTSLLKEYDLEWLECDILDTTNLERILVGVTGVIHCAAMVSYHKQDEYLMYRTNVKGTRNLVNCCINVGVKYLLHLSSVAALGRKAESREVDENTHWSESPLNSAYARTKYLSELEVWRGEQEGLEVCVMNPSVVIAPGDGQRSSSKLLKYVWDQKRFYTSGSINFVDVRDVAKLVVDAYEKKVTGERFVVSADSIKYKDLFGRLAFKMKKKTPSIKAGPTLIKIVYVLDQIKFFVTRIRPTVTKEMLKSASSNIVFMNQKSKDYFSFNYRSIDDTVTWACEEFELQMKR